MSDKVKKKRRLTLKQERFIDAYIETGNATEAARRAGYGDETTGEDVLATIGWENLRKLEIQRRIDERLKQQGVTANEVINTLSAIMRADITDVYDEHGKIDIGLIRKRKIGHLVKGISYRKGRIARVEFESRTQATSQLSKILGIEKEPQPNDPAALARRMFDKLMREGINADEARQALIALGVDPAHLEQNV